MGVSDKLYNLTVRHNPGSAQADRGFLDGVENCAIAGGIRFGGFDGGVEFGFDELHNGVLS
jgi:hypothetical protein